MMKNISILFALLIITSFPLHSQDIFTPDSYILEAHEKGESLSDEDFIYYALKLSEIDDSKIPAYLAEYKELANTLENDLNMRSLSSFDTGEYILQFLHKHMFKNYRESITNLNNLFDSGVYNCVSSSIIYYALADRIGLEVRGVKTFDHAFCSVIIDGTITDVETTSPYGFNPGEKKEFANSFGQTGFIYTPPSNYADRTNIGKISLLSLILQNRIVELYKTQRFDTITHIAVNINALLQTNGSKEAMIREFGNYAAYLSKRKHFAQGIDFFEDATKYYGSNPKFEELSGSLFNNAIATHLSYRSIHQLKQNINLAENFFVEYKDSIVVPREIVASSQKILDEARIRTFIEGVPLNASVTEVKKYYQEQRISQQMYKDLIMYVYSKEVNSHMSKQEWQQALDIANNAIIDSENDRRSMTQLQTVEHNIGAYFHNQFAKYYNQSNLMEAIKSLNEGLALVPENKNLLSDKKIIQDSL